MARVISNETVLVQILPIFPSYSCNDSLASLISPPTFAPLCIALFSVNYEWKGLIKHGRTPLFSSFRFNPLSREGRKGSDAKYHCQPQRFRQIVRHSAFRLPVFTDPYPAISKCPPARIPVAKIYHHDQRFLYLLYSSIYS